MISYGSLMSQVLQCTQLAALICNRFVVEPLAPASSTISYTFAGQKRVQGLPYSLVQRSTWSRSSPSVPLLDRER